MSSSYEVLQVKIIYIYIFVVATEMSMSFTIAKTMVHQLTYTS